MKKAKYQMAVEMLRKEIFLGKYSTRVAFPSLTAIGRRFGLSRLTVVKVFDRLKAEGLIRSCTGSGTFVTRAGRTRKIGLIAPGVAYSEFYMPFLSAINCAATENGYMLILGEVYSPNPSMRLNQVRTLAERFVEEGVAGVVYQPLEFVEKADEINREILARFDAQGIPAVLISSDIVPSPERSRYDLVGINDFDAGRRLAVHLKSEHVRKVVFLMGAHSNYSVQNRLIGVRSLFGERGDRVMEVSADPSDVRSVRRIFAAGRCPDAIVCRSDSVASRLVVTLRQLGKRVPEDVCVAGFNDIGIAKTLNLTSVRVPSGDIADLAFRMLRERIAGSTREPVSLLLPAPLTVRDSTRRPSIRKAGR